jgi:hypothetical protein
LKGFSGKFIRRAILLTIGVIALLTYPFKLWRGEDAFWGILVGGIISVVVVSVSFAALAWSFDKSTKAFMTTYVAGFFGRMLVLCGSILLISLTDSLDLIASATSILIVYFTLTVLEINYINSYRSLQ